MYRIIIIACLFLLASCGTSKSAKDVADGNDGVNTLPPNTASNKYSKVRTR